MPISTPVLWSPTIPLETRRKMLSENILPNCEHKEKKVIDETGDYLLTECMRCRKDFICTHDYDRNDDGADQCIKCDYVLEREPECMDRDGD